MNDDSTHNEPDPLNYSAEELRVKHAQERLSAETPGELPLPGAAPISVKKTPHHFEGSYQSSLFASAGSLGRPAWSDSMSGRAAIRMISRGITGALFFTIGARYARMQLADYNPEQINKAKPLHWVAKTFDVAFGKPIAEMTRGISRLNGATLEKAELNAWNSVNFRTKLYFHGKDGLIKNGLAQNSRSLGAEMSSISFDFAMMSIGDAMTRNFIQMLDPNLKKTWWLNDQGKIAGAGEKRHFSMTKWVQSTGKAAWRIFSKSQGEDWAVALPYVYQMRMQRALFSKFLKEEVKGSKIFFDNSWNGAAYKVNAEGKIVGDYNLIGAMDLHARFVGYNVYTLMFREGYDMLSHKFKQWKADGFAVHPHLPQHPVHAFAKGSKDLVRYVIKSTIKGNMYMNPAVIPFWLVRVPSSKWRGGLVNIEAEKAENALASTISYDERVRRRAELAGISEAEMAERMVVTKADGTRIVNYNTAKDRIEPHQPGAAPRQEMYLHNKKVENPIASLKNPYDSKQYEHFEGGVSKGFSKALNPIGRFTYWLGGKATQAVEALPKGNWFKEYAGMNEGNPMGPSDAASRERFMRTFVDASLAYTPYFYAKTEFGLRVDDTPSNGSRGRMDTAIYGLMDNLAAFKFRSAGKSLKHMWYLSTHVNKDPIMREGGVIKDDTATVAPATAAATPRTTIQTQGRKYNAPVELSREENTHTELADDADTNHRWAQILRERERAGKFTAPTSPYLN